VEQVPVIIYNWGVAGDIDHVTENYVSPYIEEILGFTPEEWMADPTLWFTRVHPDDWERIVAGSSRSIEEAVPFRMEYRMLAKDGRVVWVRDEALVLERDAEGKGSLFQGVQLDITAQKLVEETVRKNAEEKARLIQLLAHELFTPITAIQGAALTLNTLGERLSSADLGVLSDGVMRGVGRLRRLVHNLDVAARLDREDAGVARQSVSIGEILTAALREREREPDPDPDASIIDVSVDDQLAQRQTFADLPLTAEALVVVIENALDFSAGQPIDIQLLESEEALLILVCDRGPGIPTEQHDEIFDPFTQVDSSDTRGHQGLGLGLFLARRVMRLHGGDLVHENRPGGGSIFTFRFVPAQPPG